jgi:small subunit ribosomal protein S20
MANHYSALKRARQTKRRTAVNRQGSTRLRHTIRKLREALKSGDANTAGTALSETVSVIDRSVQKGVLRKNTAARYKSRLSVRFNALKAGKAA